MPIGTLTLEVVEGKDFPSKDFLSSNDPYCKVSLAGSSQNFRTKTKSGQKCRWEETFVFKIRDDNKSVLVEVYDKDTFSADDLIGKADFDLTPIFLGTPKDSWVQLHNKHTAPAGQVRLVCTFRSDGPALPPSQVGMGQYNAPSWAQPGGPAPGQYAPSGYGAP
eukprot:CAMPEP_0172181962 /NCGR_PEP_ID=MMETSP1050-20130122/18124_1 /TAXON_ID=233186 /ORGANISM="Cryptomonas curvata, Strain CCAP979/52" /LENGTH=163 /DNA_ID=CAMNT_0012855333 /DNA_START=6 /DNA_END=494 /DNA_ORIENTATION=+